MVLIELAEARFETAENGASLEREGTRNEVLSEVSNHGVCKISLRKLFSNSRSLKKIAARDVFFTCLVLNG